MSKFIAVNIFQYVAENDEYAARSICNKHGFAMQNADTPDAMAVCLEQLVSEVGEPAMVDIVNVHPDKDLILEVYATSKGGVEEKKCNCNKKKAMQEYVNGGKSEGFLSSQGNLFIIAAALLLSVAVISK